MGELQRVASARLKDVDVEIAGETGDVALKIVGRAIRRTEIDGENARSRKVSSESLRPFVRVGDDDAGNAFARRRFRADAERAVRAGDVPVDEVVGRAADERAGVGDVRDVFVIRRRERVIPRGGVAVKRGIRLIEMLMENLGAVKEEGFVPADYADEFTFRSEEQLLAEGLIKTAIVEKSDLDF